LRLNGVFSKAKERNPTTSLVERGKFRPALDQVRAELAWFHLELIKFQHPRIKSQAELGLRHQKPVKFQAELGSSQPELNRFPLELGATRLGQRPSQPRNRENRPASSFCLSPRSASGAASL